MQGRRHWLSCVLAVTWPVLVHGYYGSLIGSLNTIYHDVTGEVYAWDENTIFIKNFNYDGTAPDAHFVIGVSGVHGSSPSATGWKLPMPDGSTTALGYFVNTDIKLTIPGTQLTSVLWLSVYCVQHQVDFGSLSFPQSPAISVPAPTVIGTFRRLAHGVRCDDIIAQDTKTFLIKNLHYDGFGPDAFFLVGTGSTVSATGATKVPDENGSLDKLHGYSGQDITIRLPGDLTMFDITWLSIYCITHSHNFGDVFLPSTLNIPPFSQEDTVQPLPNCVELSDQLQVAWEVTGSTITMELKGYLSEGQYMAFGLSGSTTRSAMVNADVFVVSIPMGGSVTVTDYFLSSYGQCTGSSGVCPDQAQGGGDNTDVKSTSVYDGVAQARFRRSLNTGDSVRDIVFQVGAPMYVVWAKGNLNDLGAVTKHSERLSGDLTVNFGSSVPSQCGNLVARAPVQLTPWQPHEIRDQTTFTARIGPAGLSQGYQALTGHNSWGIAWYINDILIPEIRVYRYTTYTFQVEGGLAATGADLARSHPFYITEDPRGGYYQQTMAERQQHRVYAGIENGLPTSNAAGRLCEWTTTEPAPDQGYPTFEAFAQTLDLQCQSGNPGFLTWTPDSSTPDLVYYQCYSHRYFGWKIHVSDHPTPVYPISPDPVYTTRRVDSVTQDYTLSPYNTAPQNPSQNPVSAIYTTPWRDSGANDPVSPLFTTPGSDGGATYDRTLSVFLTFPKPGFTTPQPPMSPSYTTLGSDGATPDAVSPDDGIPGINAATVNYVTSTFGALIIASIVIITVAS